MLKPEIEGNEENPIDYLEKLLQIYLNNIYGLSPTPLIEVEILEIKKISADTELELSRLDTKIKQNLQDYKTATDEALMLMYYLRRELNFQQSDNLLRENAGDNEALALIEKSIRKIQNQKLDELLRKNIGNVKKIEKKIEICQDIYYNLDHNLRKITFIFEYIKDLVANQSTKPLNQAEDIKKSRSIVFGEILNGYYNTMCIMQNIVKYIEENDYDSEKYKPVYLGKIKQGLKNI